MQKGLFDLACSVCGRAMIDTKSGYISCPLGHGKLLKDIPTAGDQFAPPDLFSQAAPQSRDCEHCGRDVALHVWELGGRHCERCAGLLARNAQANGVWHEDARPEDRGVCSMRQCNRPAAIVWVKGLGDGIEERSWRCEKHQGDCRPVAELSGVAQ